jgi:hypothetical protein
MRAQPPFGCPKPCGFLIAFRVSLLETVAFKPTL